MTGANSQELIKIKALSNGTVIMESGTLCQMVMVEGINFALKSEEEQLAIIRGYQNFLNSLDFTVQIVIHSRKVNIEKYLQSLDEQKQQEKSGLLQSQIAEYQEFIRSFVHEYAVMRKIFVVVIPFVPVSLLPSKDTLSRLIPFFNKKPKAAAAEGADKTDSLIEGVDEESFKESVSQLRQRVNQVVDGLRAIGLGSVVLNDEQIIELFYNYYNPETIEKQHIQLPGDTMPSSTPTTAAAPVDAPASETEKKHTIGASRPTPPSVYN